MLTGLYPLTRVGLVAFSSFRLFVVGWRMASQSCRLCDVPMDPRDGHRECPHCLGLAHVMEDVESPCEAAMELSLEERRRRAKRLEQSAGSTEAALHPEAQPSDGRHSSRAWGRRHRYEHSPERKDRRSERRPDRKRPHAADDDTQLKILAAIQSLSDRLSKVEDQRSVSDTAESRDQREELPLSSHRGLPSDQRERLDQKNPDVLSLYASEEGRLGTSLRGTESSQVSDGGNVISHTDIVSKCVTAAKIVGLNVPAETPAPVDGVWAGISRSQPSVSIPAAPDYLHMLKKTWDNPTAVRQFNAGCRMLARPQYGPETGLADMPPVEREMAALTSLGPERVTTNPRCPVGECQKTDRLVCRSYNAATRAARSGNALAILLAAIRKTVNPDEHDTRDLVDSALVAHTQLTSDIGASMSSSMLARRQIWLAQTSLPENIRRDLTNMSVVPGNVFHPDFQSVLDKAEKSRRTRECVQRTFGKAGGARFRPRGSQPSHQTSWSRRGDGRQGMEFAAPGDGAKHPPQRQQGYQSRTYFRGTPQRKRPPRGSGPRGNVT